MKRIYFAVTTDLTNDQRMRRICTSLADNNYLITLAGRKLPSSLPLEEETYRQKRIRCLFNKGKFFYIEFNIRLFFFLLFKRMDAICAADLDTILPCFFLSKIKGITRVYDAHELFTEMKEVRSRPGIKKIWLAIEKYAVPKFKNGYTVSDGIAGEFFRRYGVRYATIRNLPVLRPLDEPDQHNERFLLYQGAVNEARGLEYLIPAMKAVNGKLVICGEGNFLKQVRELIKKEGLETRIKLKGMLAPEELWHFSQKACLGIGLAEREGLNQFLALPNKFFDYMHAGLPQITMNYPEYQKINKEYEVALLMDQLSPALVAEALIRLLTDKELYNRLRQNCLQARNVYHWKCDEKKLLIFYREIFKNKI